MAERRVSVRLVAVGGRELKAELTGIGTEGQRALEGIATDGRGAAQALTGLGTSADGALAQMDALADRAARAAATLRAAGASTGTLVERIDRVTGVAPGLARSTDDIAAYGRALDDLRAKHNPLFAVIQSYRGTLAEVRQAHAVGAISADELAAAISRERQAALASIAAIKGRSTALTQMAGVSRMAAFQSRMLMFQLNDVFVSLASGMNPMMVFIQQGAQIQQIYGGGQGGVQGALRDTGRMITGVVTRLPLLTAAVAISAAAIAGMRAEINETSAVAVSFGDTALAAWQAVRDGLVSVLKPAVDAISPWFAAAWDAVIASTRTTGNAIVNGMKAAVFAITEIWNGVPGALGSAMVAAANAVMAGIERMLNGAIDRINLFITGINGMLDMLPGWARPDGAGIGTVPEINLPDVPNPWAETPGGRSIREGIAGIMAEDPLGDLFGSIRGRAVVNASTGVLDETAKAAGRAGGAMRNAGEVAKAAAEEANVEIAAVNGALADYAGNALDWGKGLGESISGAFRSAEDAVVDFVKTGKLSIRDMVTSMITDLARLATRRFVLGPIANALSGALPGLGSLLPGLSAQPAPALPRLGSWEGGGHTGLGARLGGLDGRGGFLAMLHPRERVVDETRRGRGGPSPVVINIHTRDAQSFRQSRTQVASDIARAVAAGRRGL